MPFYEYQCSACGERREELQKISDPPSRKCPACRRNTLRRLVSAPVFRLKGGGWYETDFKADKEQMRNIAGDKEPAVAASIPDSKTKDDKAGAKAAEKPAPEAPPAKAAEAKPKAADPKPTPTPTPTPARRRRTRRGR